MKNIIFFDKTETNNRSSFDKTETKLFATESKQTERKYRPSFVFISSFVFFPYLCTPKMWLYAM